MTRERRKTQNYTTTTVTLSPAEAGDLNAYFEVVPAAGKRYVSGQGFLFKRSSTQSSLQALEVSYGIFRAPSILGSFYTA